MGGVCKVGSEWEGDLGCLDYEGVPVEVPNALARLSANQDLRNFDLSGVGPGSDVMAENRSMLRSEVAEFITVRIYLTLLLPRSLLLLFRSLI